MNNLKKTKSMWIVFNAVIGFALYWVSNLYLWFPWSINENLGIALMLSASPVLWSWGIYQCLKRYSGENLFFAAVTIGITFLTISAISDFLFFGIIREAMEHLLMPTTFYGYLYLLILPFFVLLIFRKQLIVRKVVLNKELILYSICGLLCIFCIAAIINFDISF